MSSTEAGAEVNRQEVAFVTGAGSGIGRAVARRLASRGADLCLFDLSADGLEETAAAIRAEAGSRLLTSPGDVRDEMRLRETVEEAEADLGPLNTVAACAGIEVEGTVVEMDPADWDRVLGVNLTGVFNTARVTMPSLEKSGDAAFVAISSDAGIFGTSNFAAYCASKHGVIGLVRTLALDHGPKGVRCNAVCPGFTETPMAERIMAGISRGQRESWQGTVPLGRFGNPDEIAAAVAHLTSVDSSYVNGAVYSIDGGSTAGYFQP